MVWESSGLFFCRSSSSLKAEGNVNIVLTDWTMDVFGWVFILFKLSDFGVSFNWFVCRLIFLCCLGVSFTQKIIE